MSRLLLPLKLNTDRVRPLGDIVSSCVRDLDVTVQASYGGTGTDWLNIESSPADSETQAQYDAEGTGASQPTFTGTTGDAGAYFLFDGGDYFAGKNSLTTFEDSIHKTTGGSDFAFVMTIYYINASVIFITNRQAGNPNIGVMMYTTAGTDNLLMLQRGDTGNSSGAQTIATLNTSAWNFIACSHEHSSGTTRLWINSTTSEERSNAFNATTAAASASNLAIGSYGDGTLPLANTTRIKSVQVFNEYLTNSQMSDIIAQLNLRHNTTYA